MAGEVKHTPTPWQVTEPADKMRGVTIRAVYPSKPIAEMWWNGDDPEANAEFIVMAVNVHDELVAVVEACNDALHHIRFDGDLFPELAKAARMARAVLAKLSA